MSKTAYLVLEDGKIFEGEAFGYECAVTGEVVFNTSMTGYLETITDPSYYGQIVVQTFPLIGNYGVISEDFESMRPGLFGYIVKEKCDTPSNFRSEGSLNNYLAKRKISAISGIDTRALTKLIRERGTINGRICYDLKDADTALIKDYRVTNAVKCAALENITTYNEQGNIKIALFDFGMKNNILRELVKRNCLVTVYPCGTNCEELKKQNFDGLVLSNGPGDPTDNKEIIENIKEILKLKIPTFGICLGHQLIALAAGFSTEKLKYGHRGANQPVKDMSTGRVYMSSQNHGYAVSQSSIKKSIAIESFINVNDKTCEGLEFKSLPVFSVQFHPEACGGPLDTNYLFDRFISLVNLHKEKIYAK